MNSDLNAQSGFANVGLANAVGSNLMALLMGEDIVPGEAPGYQLCKQIYSYHPLGAILAEAPIKRAQGQERILSVPLEGEESILERYRQTWKNIGKVGATAIIENVMRTSRMYGIASIGVGEEGKDPSEPLKLEKVNDSTDLFFNVFDPLNTAGSLVLNQDPNSPNFLKQTTLYVAGRPWHPSRTLAIMNEQPLYIEWSSSAFGFVGRSVYQRTLFPLKTYIQIMITNDMVSKKVGLVVAKLRQPSSAINQIMQAMFGVKRSAIKSGTTGQVISLAIDEALESLNLQNLHEPLRLARENCIKDIASGSGMPASIIAQETLTAGFGEGTEDAKKEADYLDHIREEMQPAYTFMDRIVMRKAWTPEFQEALSKDYPAYAPSKMPYDTWLHLLMKKFVATWPNVLKEPESEKAKAQDVQMKAVVGVAEVMIPELDPENKAELFMWIADNVNERKELFASMLKLDPDLLEEHLATKKEQDEKAADAAAETEPKPAPAFSGRS